MAQSNSWHPLGLWCQGGRFQEVQHPPQPTPLGQPAHLFLTPPAAEQSRARGGPGQLLDNFTISGHLAFTFTW